VERVLRVDAVSILNPFQVPDPARDALDEPGDYEPALVLRMRKQGASDYDICKRVGISRQQLIHEMNLAESDLVEALRLGQKIQGDKIGAWVT
jgi:hypothetical protein